MQPKNTRSRVPQETPAPEPLISGFRERLRQCVTAVSGGKWTVFARESGIPKTTFQRYLAEKPSTPTVDQLVRIAKKSSRSIDWLVGVAPNDGLAQDTQTLGARSTLIPPEGAVNDLTFMQVWAKVATVWKYRADKTKDEWEALVKNVGVFAKYVKPDPVELRGPDGTVRQIDISTGQPPAVTDVVSQPGRGKRRRR